MVRLLGDLTDFMNTFIKHTDPKGSSVVLNDPFSFLNKNTITIRAKRPMIAY